eukprot:TRINITY_DN2094_c2_g1_i1.p1 TRINITY_DN2094_c2_g1~~TRINITY_DN2094_c2_g1_i1.p1  ORF type:complete len:168 (+),score=22.74 TRINITY_DN2094_c2_g1_i1:219-722(+)
MPFDGPILNHLFKQETSASSSQAEKCKKYEVNHDSSGKPWWDRLRYPWHVGVRRPEHKADLYGTGWAQQTIWNHQNPPDCSRAKFLVFPTVRSGIGSNLHVLGQGLAYAMSLGRILVLPAQDPGNGYFDASFCPGKASWECYFLPLTHCPVKGDVLSLSDISDSRFV